MDDLGDLDVAVIGAGSVGLAITRALTLKKLKTAVFEQEKQIGQHTSSHGSGVIHSGIYYPKDSLKAKLCVEGKDLLYRYAKEKNIPHKRLGKIIVATSEEQIPRLHELQKKGFDNGIKDLKLLSKNETLELEPEINAVAGLLSPSTGIIDAVAYMNMLQEEIEKIEGKVITGKKVISISLKNNGFELTFSDNETIFTKQLINSAGLFAQEVAANIEQFPKNKIPPTFYAKGHYFRLKTPCPFNHLIYPLPVPGGLGIHVTQKLDGIARFGPDVVWIDKIDYSFEADREKEFYNSIRTYFPTLPDNSLEPDYTGIRPKIVPPGTPEQDFIIQTQQEHQIPGLINLFGIESPGLTSSLAIADNLLKLFEL